MARQINMLSTTKINALKDRGFYADGGGLYLQVAPGGSKSWVFRYKGARADGKARDMGLGPFHTINLSEAREQATECRKLRLLGIDPIEKRDAERAARKADAAKVVTFKECAEAYMAQHRDTWKNDKHAAQWPSSLEAYVYPIIGALPVQAVDTALVLKVLQQSVEGGEQFWKAKRDTAEKVRGRIEIVIDYATPQHRTGDNPAQWKILKSKLAKRTKKKNAQPALPYVRAPEFMADLRTRESISAKALELLILTSMRTDAVRRARWTEFDFAEKLWTVPAERMKGTLVKSKAHRVALSKRAVALLTDLQKTSNSEFVFPGNTLRPISDASMGKVIKIMNLAAAKSGRPLYVDPKENNRAIVPHGFRSTFKTWASECTNFANEISEAALGHASGDDVERAHSGTYGRGDLFEKRQKLMDAWAGYCAAPAASGAVVSINRKAG